MSTFNRDHINKELYIANGDKDYTYIFHLETGFWFKIDQKFEWFVHKYPYYEIISTINCKDLHDEVSSGNIDVLVQTRPITLDSEGLKQTLRLLTRDAATLPAANKTGVYIFGSIDGREWAFLKGIQHLATAGDTTFENQVVGPSHVSCRYFIIIYTANVSKVTIKNFDITYKHKYQSKIH